MRGICKYNGKPHGLVVWHRDGLGGFKAFDIFIRNDLLRQYKYKFNWLYDVSNYCRCAKILIPLLKDYTYVGSEDDLHSFPINLEVPKEFKVIHIEELDKNKMEKLLNEIGL